MVAPAPQLDGPFDTSAPVTALRVAVVDRDDAVRRGLMFAILAVGFAADGFPSGPEFLHSDLSRYFCLIAAEDLGDMRGRQLIVALRAGRIGLPVMLLVEPRSEPIALSQGVIAAEKPVALPELEAFIIGAAERSAAAHGG